VARQGFDGFTIESNGVRTTLIADLDQAALYGALNRLQSLDLDLIEVTRTSAGTVNEFDHGAVEWQPPA
jgi:hypothetical protein